MPKDRDDLVEALASKWGIGPEEAAETLSDLEKLGLAIVPVEPTGDMRMAGGEAQQRSIGSWGEPWVVYAAML